ncbi:hypothetical protein [Streptomyces sp. TS71-3]|uniref:hypothetical protein n=1 Tax=Streptomyces sp. TS71-3 TaxID=2733862 RepID=UPI0020177752|nr:hypothetical protein [Streptomyces sp. TS71-3]
MDDATAFPHDLLAAERARRIAYQALAKGRPERTTTLRRRLLRLSAGVWFHPHWAARSSGVPAARVELRRRAHDDGRCAEGEA